MHPQVYVGDYTSERRVRLGASMYMDRPGYRKLLRPSSHCLCDPCLSFLDHRLCFLHPRNCASATCLFASSILSCGMPCVLPVMRLQKATQLQRATECLSRTDDVNSEGRLFRYASS